MVHLTPEDLDDLRRALEEPTADDLPVQSTDRERHAQRRARHLVLSDAAAEVAEIMHEVGAAGSPEVWSTLVAEALEARQ